jgi:hypothetical protein
MVGVHLITGGLKKARADSLDGPQENKNAFIAGLHSSI